MRKPRFRKPRSSELWLVLRAPDKSPEEKVIACERLIKVYENSIVYYQKMVPKLKIKCESYKQAVTEKNPKLF